MDEPKSLRAGDSASWPAAVSAYPPGDGWSLNYRLLWPAGASAVDIAAAVEGDSYRVDLTAEQTAAWSAGTVTLVRFVTRGAERKTLGSQPLEILPDLTAVTHHDGRTPNEIALAHAEAALAAYVAKGQAHVAEYEVAGRKMKFRTVDEIKDLIRHYKTLVAQEKALAALLQGGSPPGRVYYRG